MTLFYFTYAFVIGLCFGSFGNVVIHRLPIGKSILSPSCCSNCNLKLGVLDLIPVISWVFLKGRCRGCKGKISIRYPIVEIICGILFAGMLWFYPSVSVIPLALFSLILLCTALIDLDTQEIYDVLLIIGALIGVVYVLLPFFEAAYSWQDALVGAVVGGMTLFILDKICLLFFNKDGFGYGDMKLMAVAGIFLGWQNTLIAFALAFIAGAVCAIYLLLSKRIERGEYLAFGPFLCLGIVFALWFGDEFNRQLGFFLFGGW